MFTFRQKYAGKHGGGRRGGAIQRARTRWHGWQEEEEEKKKRTHIKSDVKQKYIDQKRGVSQGQISSDHLTEKG